MVIKANRKNRFKLWLQWIAANAVGELVGLGTLSIIASKMDEGAADIISTLSFSLIMIVLGAWEGIAIGLAQWLVLRKIISRLTSYSWILASLIGAVIAWILGMLPSTMMNLTGQSENTSITISEVQVILFAVVMGIVLGLILALPQWIVLRKYFVSAYLWLPANSVAWALGMAFIFFMAGNLPEEVSKFQIIATLLLTTTITGAMVGAIHGFVLVWLLRLKRSN